MVKVIDLLINLAVSISAISISVVSISLVSLPSSSAAAASGKCSKELLSNFIKGPIDAPANEKTVRLEKLRDAILAAAQDQTKTEEAECLMSFYEKANLEMLDYWDKVGDSPTCLEDCQAERSKRLSYLKNAAESFRIHALQKLHPEKYSTALTASKCEPDPMKKNIDALKSTRDHQCCGDQSIDGREAPASAKKTGLVYSIYPSATRDDCVKMIDNNAKPVGAFAAVGDCAKKIILKFMDTMWENLTSIFKAPAQLWAAREQLSQIKFDRTTFEAMKDKLLSAITDMLPVAGNQAYQCLNDYEKKSWYCDKVGEIAAYFASPVSLISVFKLIAGPIKMLSGGLQKILMASGKGKSLLAITEKIETVSGAATKTAKTVALGAKSIAQFESIASKASKLASRIASIENRPLRVAAKAAKWVGDAIVDQTPLTLLANRSALTARAVGSSAGIFVTTNTLNSSLENSKGSEARQTAELIQEQEALLKKSQEKFTADSRDYLAGQKFMENSVHDSTFVSGMKAAFQLGSDARNENLAYHSFDRDFRRLEQQMASRKLSLPEVREFAFSAAASGRAEIATEAYVRAFTEAKTETDKQTTLAELRKLGLYKKDWLIEVQNKVLDELVVNRDRLKLSEKNLLDVVK